MEIISDVNNGSCNSSADTHDAVFKIKLVTSSISCFTNLVATFIMVCGGSYKRLITRSVLYLLVSNFLLVAVQVLELTPVTYRDGHVVVKDGWLDVCRVLGFFDQITAWVRDLVVIFIVLQLFVMIKNPADFFKPQSVTSKMVEAVSICICFLLPFTFNWIPFLDNYYGLSGHWCWIKLMVNDCGDEKVLRGFTYMMALYYCPLMVIVLATTLLCFYIIWKWCTRTGRHLEIIVVILYPMIFDVLCLIMFANRLDSALRVRSGEEPLYFLWVLHALADSGRTLLPSISVFLLLFCRTSRHMLIPRAYQRENHTADDTTRLIREK